MLPLLTAFFLWHFDAEWWWWLLFIVIGIIRSINSFAEAIQR